MTKLAKILATAAVIGALAAPAVAQYPYPYPQPYPQPYPYPYPGQTYPGQPYGGNVVGSIIDQLLGNRYSVSDRGFVSRCADAALAQAASQYRSYNPYGYGQQYNYNYGMRVVGITDVERRTFGLRVRGLIDSGLWYGPYGNQYYGQGALNSRYGDLTFRCNVDFRGYVTDVRIRQTDSWRRPF